MHAASQQTCRSKTTRILATVLSSTKLSSNPYNMLVIAMTGSGKTLVSVLLIKDKAGTLNVDGRKRVTVFLAPKVLLVQQVCTQTPYDALLEIGTHCLARVGHQLQQHSPYNCYAQDTTSAAVLWHTQISSEPKHNYTMSCHSFISSLTLS